MLDRVKRIHMVGIGGIGMSGIAALLHGQGYEVSGSDLTISPSAVRLREAGVRVAEGHAADAIGRPDVVVVSSAVPRDNPELVEARRRGIPVIPRGAMLAELTRLKRSVAVVGSHGKTTTTSMVAFVLQAAGFDPTVVVGGQVDAFGGNARQGQGPLMVLEADESDRSFLELAPEVAVLTNVDDEHLEAYDGIAGLQRAFAAFASRVPDTGCVVACADDHRLARLAAECPRRVRTYGIEAAGAHVRARDLELGGRGSRCRVTVTADTERDDALLELAVPGRHNLLDALAAVAVASWFGIRPAAAAGALRRFRGVERRFERHLAPGGIEIVDDYGHHPTEIAAVIETARLSAPRRLIVVFQPHRYTRTARLLDAFGRTLARADAVIVTEVYAASEAPIDGVDARAVAGAVRRHAEVPVTLAAGVDEAAALAVESAGAGDMIVVLGAGSISRLRGRIIDHLGRQGT